MCGAGRDVAGLAARIFSMVVLFYGILLVGFGAGILAGWDYIIQLEESFDDLISKSHSITGLFDGSDGRSNEQKLDDLMNQRNQALYDLKAGVQLTLASGSFSLLLGFTGCYNWWKYRPCTIIHLVTLFIILVLEFTAGDLVDSAKENLVSIRPSCHLTVTALQVILYIAGSIMTVYVVVVSIMAVFALSERFGCVRRCMPCKSCRKKKERRQTTHDDYDGYQPENNKAKKKKTRTTVETNTSKTWATWV